MKRFLLALAAVAAITVGSSFTNSAMAHGPGYGHHSGSCGPRYGGGYGGYGYGGGYGGGYGSSYGYYPQQNFGYASPYGSSFGYSNYGNPGFGGYGYGNGGVIQLYGPRGGFTFGF